MKEIHYVGHCAWDHERGVEWWLKISKCAIMTSFMEEPLEF